MTKDYMYVVNSLQAAFPHSSQKHFLPCHSVNTSQTVSLLLFMLYDKYIQLVLFLYIIITGVIKPDIMFSFYIFSKLYCIFFYIIECCVLQ